MTIFSLLGYGPKWDISCGECEGTFRKRLPLIDNPGIQCPYCGAINILSLKYK